MAHRHTEISLGARICRALALVALTLAGLSTIATRAQAGLDPVGGDDSTPAVGVVQVPAPERSRPERPAAPDKARDEGRDRARESKPKPAPAPEPELAEVRNAAGERLEVSDDACRENLAIAAEQGLMLPDGWKLYCVGPGLDWNGGTHWGVTCPYADCPEGAGPYVSISNPTYYVVAHELCHANFGNDELMADRCAAEHGASLETSPYS